MRPNKFDNFALIIGAMKSGTTTLFHYLAQHPEIACSSPKEPNFFACDTNFSKGMDWYRNLWQFDSKVHKLALEASTHYTKMPHFPNAAKRIELTKANFKFIYILRNPIERIESQYTHGLSEKWHRIDYPLSQGVHPNAINNSKYATQMEEYYKRFSADSILLIDFEDLKKRPIEILSTVCNFLELDPEFKFTLRQPSNQSKEKFVDRPLWHSIEPIAKVLPKLQRHKIRSLLGKRITGRLSLSESQQEYVLNELRDDLLKLNSDYGFDISKWGFNL